MQIIRNIVQSPIEPSQKEVGWLTIEDGKPKLKFNSNGVWTEVSSVSEDTGEPTGFISPYAKVLSGKDGSTWLASVRPNTDLSDDSAIIDIHLMRVNAEECLLGVELEYTETVGFFKSLDADYLQRYDDSIGNHQINISAIKELQEYNRVKNLIYGTEIVILPGIHSAYNQGDSTVTLNIKDPEGDYDTYNILGLTTYLLLSSTVTTVKMESDLSIISESPFPLTLTGEGFRLLKFVYFKIGSEWGVVVTVEGTNFKNHQ